MDTINQTLLIVWLAALIGPIMIYGVLMQIWMMNDEGGEKFLQDRQSAAYNAKRENWRRGDDYAEARGKAARLDVGIEAAKGKYGTETQLMIGEAWVVMKYYAIYAAILLAIGAGYLMA